MTAGPASPTFPAPGASFIGRVSELDRLGDWLAGTVQRVPATVFVGGEAGVGKSRLLREFAGTARAGGALVLWGGCVALGTGAVPYTPLIDALRRLVRERGEEAVRQLGGPAYAELSSLISDATDRPVGEPTGQQRVFDAVLRLLDRFGAHAPTVLIFEDLHWADPSTLDLVLYLTRAQTDERVLLLCSHRWTDLDRRHPLRTLLAEPDFTRRIRRLDLPRFTRAELELFLRAAADGHVDDHLVTRYFELSEGNAFFAEELMVAGVLTDPAMARLPGSLSDVMLSRFEMLGEDAADVIRVAAAAGRRVGHRLLAQVCDLADRALIRALRECVHQHMLVTDPADDTYVFRHALLREAVYQDLLPGERIRLHAALARALAADPGLGLAEDLTAAAELAYHWFAANDLPQALRAAVRAGEMAERVRAFREAEQQYRRALELWPRVSDPESLAGTSRERVLAAAADACRWAGHVDRAVQFARAALVEVDPAVDPRRAGELYERLGSYLWEAGAGDDSHEAYRAAAGLLAGQPDTAVTARVLAGLATAAVRAGRYAEGMREGGKAVAMARSVGARAEEGRALNTLGMALTMLDRTTEGVENLRAALRIAEEVDHLEDLVRAYGNLAVALEHVGRLTESVRVALDGLELARRRGLERTRGAGVLANNAAATLVLLGRWDEATAIVDDVLRDRPVRESLYPRLTLAEIQVARGAFAAAGELLATVGAAGRATGEPRFLGPLHTCLAELAIWRNDLDGARTAVADGLAALDGVENVLVLLRLAAVGLRAAADECLLRHALPDARDADAAVRADELVALIRRTVPDPSVSPEVTALWRLCLAERTRADGRDDAATWRAVADAWAGIDRPYPTAYARWREAEAAVAGGDPGRATDAAREAYEVAGRLSAAPLRAEIEATARRNRLDLTGAPEPAEADVAPARPDPFGLTLREREVLRHLCAGRTNRQIAAELFIAERTVSVHVSNILAKLGVPNRAAAATTAHRLRLVDPADEPVTGRTAPTDRTPEQRTARPETAHPAGQKPAIRRET